MADSKTLRNHALIAFELGQYASHKLLNEAADIIDFMAVALDEWFERTDWVDENLPTKYLGWHRAAAINDMLAESQKDAERYRLLRRGQKWSVIDGKGDTLRADALDAAIDAARSAP